MEIWHFNIRGERMNSKNRGYQIASYLLAVFISIGLFSVNGCYYDSEEELYPSISNCDTTNVTYSGVISDIMYVNCNSCHGPVAPESNIRTDNYTDLKTIVDNGKLLNVIMHSSGFPAMPKDRPALSDCDISKIQIWITAGAQNN
jgi:hypothetical protein